MNTPLCFVLMPFGKKPTASGFPIDFDNVYSELFVPAIVKAGLKPLRADEEMSGGIIHKAMFERLILCEYAVADLTTANANVFYELGVRHAVRPWSTVLTFAKDSTQLPFDVKPLRALPYSLDSEGKVCDVTQTKTTLTNGLIKAKKATTDSPVFQLVEGFPNVDHSKTDVFRDRVNYSLEIKEQLMAARKSGCRAVKNVEKRLGRLSDQETAVLIDLLLSYRATDAWRDMIELTKQMSAPVANTALVQEQLAFALNRVGDHQRAERILLQLISKRGPSSETYGLLGRVYKDQWEYAQKIGKKALAAGFLNKAISAYVKGFETDWRDAYPGINAVTLMELKVPPEPLRLQLIPVVHYSVQRRIAIGKPDYWDYATLLELAFLNKDQESATSALSNALASAREKWELQTTARNLRLITASRSERKDLAGWEQELLTILTKEIKEFKQRQS